MTISPVPSVPESVGTYFNSASIRVATPDLIAFKTEEIPLELMTDLVFEDIGGQEILSVARNDTVNGQKIIYSPIKNLSLINQKYNPLNIFTIPSSSQSIFDTFALKLENYVPEVGENSNRNQVSEVVYLEKDSGDIVVNVINLAENEEVEIRVFSSVNSFGDIDYS